MTGAGQRRRGHRDRSSLLVAHAIADLAMRKGQSNAPAPAARSPLEASVGSRSKSTSPWAREPTSAARAAALGRCLVSESRRPRSRCRGRRRRPRVGSGWSRRCRSGSSARGAPGWTNAAVGCPGFPRKARLSGAAARDPSCRQRRADATDVQSHIGGHRLRQGASTCRCRGARRMSPVVSRPAFACARTRSERMPGDSFCDAQQRETRGQLVDVVVGGAPAGTRGQQGQARF